MLSCVHQRQEGLKQYCNQSLDREGAPERQLSRVTDVSGLRQCFRVMAAKSDVFNRLSTHASHAYIQLAQHKSEGRHSALLTLALLRPNINHKTLQIFWRTHLTIAGIACANMRTCNHDQVAGAGVFCSLWLC